MSIFLTIFFFNKAIALLAIFYLTFGDGFAALIGDKYGKHKIFYGKSWAGIIADFITCIIVGVIFLRFYPLNYLQIFFGALTATVVEILPSKDNLLIPVVSAFVVTLLK